MPAEENSPVDCFRRRGQGAKRREGVRQYAEKSLRVHQKIKSVAQAMLFIFYIISARDSNKEGAG